MNGVVALMLMLNESPNFQDDILPLFKTRCTPCHNSSTGLPVWEDYETSFNKRAAIRHRVFELQDMPRGNATGMTPAEREIVARWVDIGAPFTGK